MTVSYTGDVANGSSFGCFWKILGRWKGSVYKLIWRELIAYLFIYFTFNFIYRYGMDSHQRHTFEKVKVYCSKQIESIPMSFVLGFYVTLIVKRWWDQYWLLPLPDNLALYISSSLHGQDERGRILRRTIMRYTILAFIITLQRISFRVKKRFPTLQHLVDAGLMMESEKKIFDNFEEKTTVSKFWMPTVWASNLVNRAKLEGRIQSDQMLQTIIMELSDFRRRLGRVMVYDTVSVPLVYTQVVTLAVYTYFIAALIGRQWVHPDDVQRRNSIYPGYELDLCFPIFLSLQFIFYVGWLKVAETLINPFGEDDDDFELNWLIDRHIQVSYMVVDEMHEEHPELLRDQYWDQVVPAELPYNIASGQFRRKEPQGSTASMKIKINESVYDSLPVTKRQSSVVGDEVYADLVYSFTGQESVIDSPQVDHRKTWIQRHLSRVESIRSTSSSSSLFNRNRIPQVQPNGGSANLTTNMGHRMSLYEKLKNRRSSKEKNSPRVPPSRALTNGGTTFSKDTLMPHSLSRPRVPTPDVSKDIQLNTTSSTISPVDNLNVKTNVRSMSTTSPETSIPHANHLNPYITSNPLSNSGGNTENITLPSTITQPLLSPNSPPPSNESLLDPTLLLMLSPIEENDGSPYSTSSTNRSSKSSSNHPTTSIIFGRKPSPPPPKDKLLLIPLTTRPISLEMMNGKSDFNPLDSLITTEGKGIVNAGFEIDESEDEPYQTISEVNEAKADYIRNSIQNIRGFHGGRRYSKEKRDLMLHRLHSSLSPDKSSQASFPIPILEKSDRSGGRNDATCPLPITTQASPQHSRLGSYDKCTNTEVDLYNNNNTVDIFKQENPTLKNNSTEDILIKRNSPIQIDERICGRSDPDTEQPSSSLATLIIFNETKSKVKREGDCEVFV